MKLKENFVIITFTTVLLIKTGVSTKCSEVNSEQFGPICYLYDVKLTKENNFIHPTSKNNRQINTVVFSNSKVHTLTKEICEAFPNLKRITMREVSLEKIEPDAFYKCKNLYNVFFMDNNLTQIDRHLFKENRKLQNISFEMNNLEIIDGKMFENLTELGHLDLSNNNLTEFPVQDFPKLERLQTLLIHENWLTDLDADVLMLKFPYLQHISMHSNKFDCDRLNITIQILERHEIKIREVSEDFSQHIKRRHHINGIQCESPKSEIVCQAQPINTLWIFGFATSTSLLIILLLLGMIFAVKYRRNNNNIHNDGSNNDNVYDDSNSLYETALIQQNNHDNSEKIELK